MFEEVFLFARRTNFGYFREWACVASAKTGDNAQRGKKSPAELFILLSTLRLKIDQTECKCANETT